MTTFSRIVAFRSVLAIIRVWVHHWWRWRGGRLFWWFLLRSYVIPFWRNFTSGIHRTWKSSKSSLILILYPRFLDNIETHDKCQYNYENTTNCNDYSLNIVSLLKLTLRLAPMWLLVVTGATTIKVTIPSDAFTIIIAIVPCGFVTLTYDLLSAMAITAASSCRRAVSVVDTSFVTHHWVRTHTFYTTTTRAFKSEVAKIFLHFKPMETYSWMSTRIITTAKCAHEAVLIFATKDLLNAFIQILV